MMSTDQWTTTTPLSWYLDLYRTGLRGLQTCTQVLLRQFRPGEVSQVQKAGQKLDYIETNACIDRLNEAFTPLGWSWDYESGDILWGPAAPDQGSRHLALIGRLTIHLPWGDVTKTGTGSRFIEAEPGSRKMDFGDDIKAASSDALKKAASLLGIYNYGYRKGTQSNVSREDLPVLTQLQEIGLARGLTNEQLLEICSGIVRKTVLSAADLSRTQAQACIAMLQAPQAGPDND